MLAFARTRGSYKGTTVDDNEGLLAINPNWEPPASGKNIVVFIQASTSSDLPQKVVVAGEGLPEAVIGQSESWMSYGTQYLNYEMILPSSTLPYPNWRWSVAITHSPDQGETWVPSNVRTSDAVSINAGLMYAVYALCNDDDSIDTDYNDTVVQIVAFSNSRD